MDGLVCDEIQEMHTKGREVNLTGPMDKAMKALGFDLGLKKWRST